MRFREILQIVLLLTLAPLARGQTLETFHYFNGGDGGSPECALVQGLDGGLYGTTFQGGSNYYGTAFRISTNGLVTALFSFDNWTNGGFVHGGLIQGTDGNLYGATASSSQGSGTVFRMTTNGLLTTLLYTGRSRLTQGSDGNFYGTVRNGPFSNPGIVFRMTTNGAVTSLVSFNGTNGANPDASLVEGDDGYFYGTTYQGGVSNLGTVFKMTTNGVLTTLVSFNGTNGAFPRAELVQRNDGNFYGTTFSGGMNNAGTVFKITANGLLTSLFSFINENGGPSAGLVQHSDGNFYGTTQGLFGGDGINNLEGNGSVFTMTPDGQLTTLFVFDGTNGANPRATLIEGNDGNLYGSTRGGNLEGDPTGAGTIFRLVMPVSLNSRMSGNELVLSWPTNALGFTLQTAADLNSSTNWMDSTNAPAIVGAQFMVTNNISGNAQFYRLKK